MAKEKEKRIETVEMIAKDINTNFGNPRKISAQKKKELKQSLETYGDFGLFLIDENNSVIAGNQRLEIIKEINPETKLLCKKLIGYTQAELRAINIKDNTHAGEWDIEALADWTADLNLDLGIDLDNGDPNERKIDDMELIRYEKYNYVLICCRYETDYNDLCRKLGIEGKKVKVSKSRKIKARAIWYEDMKAQIVDKFDVKEKKEKGE